MSDEMKMLIAFLVTVAAITIGGLVMISYSCAARWADSGLTANYQWSAVACVVTLKDGTKVPERAIRNVDIK
jgi:hypothetical protein